MVYISIIILLENWGYVKFREKTLREMKGDGVWNIVILIVVVVKFLDALLLWETLYSIRITHARKVFRIVVERVGILIAIKFYLHPNFTLQMARPGDSRPCH